MTSHVAGAIRNSKRKVGKSCEVTAAMGKDRLTRRDANEQKQEDLIDHDHFKLNTTGDGASLCIIDISKLLQMVPMGLDLT